MRLVVCYDSGGREQTVCFYHGTPESWLAGFEQAMQTCRAARPRIDTFIFAGQEFYLWDFIKDVYVVLPKVYELNEWFTKEVRNAKK